MPRGLWLSLVVFSFMCLVYHCAGEGSSNTEEPQNTDDVSTDQINNTPSTQGGAGESTDYSTPNSGQGADLSQNQPEEAVAANDAGFNPDECAIYTAAAKQREVQVEKQVPVEITEERPVSIYVMLDQSFSMLAPDPEAFLLTLSGQEENFSKWVTASRSIGSFVNDSNSAGINVAIQFFPLIAGCDGSVYDAPIVPMGRLPGNAVAILDSLLVKGAMIEDTPIEPALLGATRYCKQFKNDPVANPDGEDCVVVFITDGMPSTCNTDADYIASIVGDAYQNDGISTFVIGMDGADFNILNLIAEQGQGPNDCHPDDPSFYFCNVSENMTLLQALEHVRSVVTRIETRIEYETVIETEALACEWEIPRPPKNEVLDKEKVNVEFSDGVQPAYQIPRAESRTACGDDVAWYYDETVTNIVACPQACATIQSAKLAAINIVLGCVSVILE